MTEPDYMAVMIGLFFLLATFVMTLWELLKVFFETEEVISVRPSAPPPPPKLK